MTIESSKRSNNCLKGHVDQNISHIAPGCMHDCVTCCRIMVKTLILFRRNTFLTAYTANQYDFKPLTHSEWNAEENKRVKKMIII